MDAQVALYSSPRPDPSLRADSLLELTVPRSWETAEIMNADWLLLTFQ